MEKRRGNDAVTTDSFTLQHEVAGLRLLQQVALLTAATGNNTEVLPELLCLLQEAFAVDGGGIFQLQQAESPLTLIHCFGIEDDLQIELQKIPTGKGLAFEVIRQKKTLDWIDLRGATNLHCNAILDAGWRSLLMLPLCVQGQIRGVLFFFQRIPRQFSQTEIELLESLCVLIAANIDTHELLEKLEWQHRLNQAGQRELERSRRQLRDHLKRLETANSTLEQLNRMKDRFLTLASHELRTPLTWILSAGQLLEQQLQGAAPEVMTLLSTMLQGGERLNSLVEDLLEMARIESRDIYLAHESIDLNQLLQSLVQKKEAAASLCGIKIRRGKIPDLVSPCGDRYHLERALGHLIDNAIKFSPAGAWIEIDAHYIGNGEIRSRQKQLEPFCPQFFTPENLPDMVDIRITDSGTGIDEKERLRIFEKFHSSGDINLHGRNRGSVAVPSLGLGLPLAKGLIEAHSGLLWSENHPSGKGSIFHSMLPLFQRRKQIVPDDLPEGSNKQ